VLNQVPCVDNNQASTLLITKTHKVDNGDPVHLVVCQSVVRCNCDVVEDAVAASDVALCMMARRPARVAAQSSS
jgi:hypothetical protein